MIFNRGPVVFAQLDLVRCQLLHAVQLIPPARAFQQQHVVFLEGEFEAVFAVLALESEPVDPRL